MIALGPLGDRAVLARFASEAEAARWASAVRARGWPGVEDVVLAYRSAAVFADPDRIAPEELEDRLRSLVADLDDRTPTPGRLIRLPVLYDGEDLPEVARRLGMTASEVVANHSGRDYIVFAIGFLPGFPYLGYLPETLCGLPRREAPRVRVPAGSVAIAGRQTGVYPAESPGGWYLLGRTPLRIVDVARGHFPIRAGDRVRFEPIGPAEFDAWLGEDL
ncbi:MAG: 5-oxoprolinase subunit PxpB [Planctomycetaceae bacterium]|nr:5-oxoprolinase subunit PxpB [Planctomycetaceae bacterium]